MDALHKLDVRIRSFGELEPSSGAEGGPGRRGGKAGKAIQFKSGFMFKIFALAFSSFEETIYLDTDVVAMRDPEYLFDDPRYQEHGSVFWMDFWNASSAPDCQSILGAQTQLPYTHESGQMLVDKRVTWRALMLATYMNSFPNFYYPLTVNYMGWGDKEVLPMAILAMGQQYHLIKVRQGHCRLSPSLSTPLLLDRPRDCWTKLMED